MYIFKYKSVDPGRVLKRVSLPPSYYCLGQRLGRRLGHRRSLLPLLPYVYIEAIEPHSIDSSHSFLTIGARTTDRQN